MKRKLAPTLKFGLKNGGEWKQIRDTEFNLKNAIYIENLKPSIEEEAGIGWQILAFFVPIAGMIMFFNNSKESPNKAKRYIQVAGFGLAFAVLLRLIN